MSWYEDAHANFGDHIPNVVVRFLRKLRYKSASLGLPLTLNELRIRRWKNRYRGRRAFLIGNGPSLNKIDLSLLKDEITFGVNAIYLNKDSMGFLPTHYIVEDVFVAEDRREEIMRLKGPTKWFGNYLRYCLGDSDANWINVLVDYRNYPGFPHFSEDASRLLWVGGTVSYIGMQLAYYMGVETLYLVGFDHSYEIPDSTVVSGNEILSTDTDPNHFHKDYFGKGFRWHKPQVERMERSYERANAHYGGAGRRIVNATAGGHLEVFPRADFAGLFAREAESIAFLSMAVPEDLQVANACLPSLLDQLREQDKLYLLINGDAGVESPLTLERRYPCKVRVIRSPTNLGIARGRNHLLDIASRHQHVWYHIYDADLLAPSDYVTRLSEALAKIDPARTGIVSPLLLNAHIFVSRYHMQGDRFVTDVSLNFFKNLKKRMRVDIDSPTALAYHAGVRDWYAHYFTLENAQLGFASERWLARDHRFLLEHVNEKNWQVDALPGGVHILHKSLIDVGERYATYFSPYGYEDAELSIRFRLAGRENICLGQWCVLAHDPRENARVPTEEKVITRFLSRAKLQGYVAGRHGLDDFQLASQGDEIRRVSEYLNKQTPEQIPDTLRALTKRYARIFRVARLRGQFDRLTRST